MTPWDVLGVAPDVSVDEARSAYRTLAAIYHPDRYQSATEAVRRTAAAKMREANGAIQAIERGDRGLPARPPQSPAPMPRRAQIAFSLGWFWVIEQVCSAVPPSVPPGVLAVVNIELTDYPPDAVDCFHTGWYADGRLRFGLGHHPEALVWKADGYWSVCHDTFGDAPRLTERLGGPYRPLAGLTRSAGDWNTYLQVVARQDPQVVRSLRTTMEQWSSFP